MNLSPKYLIKLLENNGFLYKRTKGSHQVILPFHGNKDLPKGTFLAFLKHAGISKDNI
ncbi:MAG: type II toxin-antitoxin system HicA family toxin [Flavisolibacter sp.]|jgi:predicted RNA binding protein YcfA (HicA-like mRNA interferase family)|nr:type II toxin-antitoxin system HicA family toxin [Flavisolibacter sp.]